MAIFRQKQLCSEVLARRSYHLVIPRERHGQISLCLAHHLEPESAAARQVAVGDDVTALGGTLTASRVEEAAFRLLAVLV